MSTYVLVLGCGDGSATPDADASTDSADAGADAIAYPAPHAAFPTIISMGGPVLVTPRVLPITFEGDPLSATIGQFTKALHGSSYWSATTSEYGVGDLAVADTLVVPATDTLLTTPSTVTDAQIRAFLTAHLDGQHAGWGAPDPNTIYTLFYPTGITVTHDSETSCVNFGGYHLDVVVGTTPIAYAVIPRCAAVGPLVGADVVTNSASHELVEAATDPLNETNPAFTRPDDDHLVYALYPSSEVADMCGGEFDAYVEADVGFTVQRSWSNKAALAGGPPCVPVPDGNVYYAASADLPDALTIDFTSFQEGVHPTHGVNVPLGQSKTIDIDVFSTGPTDTLNLIALDLPTIDHRPTQLTFAFDQTTGKNGDKRKLTITRVANSSSYDGTAFVVAAFTDLAHRHEWTVFAGQ